MSGSLNEIMAAIAGQVKAALEPNLAGVQVEPEMVSNPTPPSIDIYPADPFLERTTFGPAGSYEATFIVRARVSAADQVGGQQLLLDLLDPRGDYSLLDALAADATFGGVVDDSTVDGGPSGFLSYPAEGGGDLVGAEWRTRVVL